MTVTKSSIRCSPKCRSQIRLLPNRAMRQKPTSVDDYIADFPLATQAALEQIRVAISGCPGCRRGDKLRYAGLQARRMLVWFAGYDKHIGFYPGAGGIAAFKKEISGYRSAKGSVQFPLESPLPIKLITEIVKFRVRENLDKAR